MRPLGDAAERFAGAADAMAARIDRMLSADAIDRVAASRIDQALMKTERAFLDAAGLPGRPWYRHQLFAPKPTYEPEILPGVSESLRARDGKQLATQVAHLVAALDRAAARLASDLDARGSR
jgi:N-acetylated-alpha-linked acidic dipeptidase